MKKSFVYFAFFYFTCQAVWVNELAAKGLTILAIPLHQNGPLQVRENLLNGLEKLGYSYNFNPRNPNEIAQTVVILSDSEIVDRAIRLKKKEKIKLLLVGPNLVVLPQDKKGILTDPNIDLVLVPCEWVKKAYEEEAPNLIGKVKVWYAGVDTDYWMPSSGNQTKKVLIYNKTGSELLCNQLKDKLVKYGYEPIDLQYGSYDHEQYKNKLDDVIFAVFISVSESQGIAMAEAWSMDTPTLIWNPQPTCPTPYDLHHYRTYSQISSAPYLTKKTGVSWKTVNDFEKILKEYDRISKSFKPREWVLQNMTLEHSAKLLLSIIQSYKEEVSS